MTERQYNKLVQQVVSAKKGKEAAAVVDAVIAADQKEYAKLVELYGTPQVDKEIGRCFWYAGGLMVFGGCVTADNMEKRGFTVKKGFEQIIDA